jgi:hypothetical protein
MRTLFILSVAVLLTATLWAQSPEKMSYQAVIRNSSNALVTNTQVGMQISILQGSASGTAVYVETQTPTSNDNGLVSVEIGNGTVVSGNFTTIDWANGPYFIKTETAVEAPLTTYTITGTSQLLSVPYALHAKTAETVTGGITHTHTTATDVADGFMSSADKAKLDDLQNVNISAGTGISVTGTYPNQTIASSHTLYLGQEYLDGIIFYLYIGSDGQQHGLVVSKTEYTGTWSGSTLVGADRTEDGAYNTTLMPAGSTAKTWVTGLGADWYLPSIDELSILWHNRFHVNKTARTTGSTLLSTTGSYWSSTERNASDAFFFNTITGSASTLPKTGTYRVRAFRAF